MGKGSNLTAEKCAHIIALKDAGFSHCLSARLQYNYCHYAIAVREKLGLTLRELSMEGDTPVHATGFWMARGSPLGNCM